MHARVDIKIYGTGLPSGGEVLFYGDSESIIVQSGANNLVCKMTRNPTPRVITATATFDIVGDENITLAYDLGIGDKAATGIASVKIEGATTPVVYTTPNEKLTIDPISSELVALGVGNHMITVTFNDVATTTDTVILTLSRSIAPSVITATATFDLLGDENIELAYDLGIGSLAATGITSS